MARTTFGTVSPTFPRHSSEQVWVAERGSVRQHFGTIEGMKDYFTKAYAGYHTNWDETNEDADGEPTPNCSKLLVCLAATLSGFQHPRDWWEDTGWRVRREQ